MPFLFQFLMVRLKDSDSVAVVPAAGEVSIPYGSIKRKSSQPCSSLLYTVSIPYGSIKSLVSLLLSVSRLSSFNSLWFD